MCLLAMSIISCNKEKETLLNTSAKSIPTFSSAEELNANIKLLEAMGEEERRTYEAQKGYKSLRTKVYELYEGVDMETLSDLDVLYQHVQRHANWLELSEDEQGALEYRPIYIDNSYSLVAGADRMIVVGESCLKIFEDGLITAPLEHMEELAASEGRYLADVPANSKYALAAANNRTWSQKSTCGTSQDNTATNGNDRTKISLECYAKLISGVIPTGEAKGQIIPQKKTLGVWFRARRTINGRFKFSFVYEQVGTSIPLGIVGSGKSIVVPFDDIVSPTLAYSVTRVYPIPTGGFYPTNYRFLSIDSFGDTPSTSNAVINCN